MWGERIAGPRNNAVELAAKRLDELRRAGVACLAELRALETIEQGAPKTPYLTFGDTVRIEMPSATGASIFGAIEQKVVRHG